MDSTLSKVKDAVEMIPKTISLDQIELYRQPGMKYFFRLIYNEQIYFVNIGGSSSEKAYFYCSGVLGDSQKKESQARCFSRIHLLKNSCKVLYGHNHESKKKLTLFYLEMYENECGRKAIIANLDHIVHFVSSKMPKNANVVDECKEILSKGPIQSKRLVRCSVDELFATVCKRMRQSKSVEQQKQSLPSSKKTPKPFKKRTHSETPPMNAFSAAAASQVPHSSRDHLSAGQIVNESQPSTIQRFVINPSSVPSSVPIRVGYQDPITGQRSSFPGYLIIFPKLFSTGQSSA